MARKKGKSTRSSRTVPPPPESVIQILRIKKNNISDVLQKALANECSFYTLRNSLEAFYEPYPGNSTENFLAQLSTKNGISDVYSRIRRDFSKNKHLGISYAIDSPGTGFIEDSIGYDINTDRIFVNIADVNRFLFDFRNGILCNEATKRCKRLYLYSDDQDLDNICTMLPLHICAKVLSLGSWCTENQKQTVDVLNISFQIRDDGVLQDPEVVLARTNPPTLHNQRILQNRYNELLTQGTEFGWCASQCRNCDRCMYHFLNILDISLKRFNVRRINKMNESENLDFQNVAFFRGQNTEASSSCLNSNDYLIYGRENKASGLNRDPDTKNWDETGEDLVKRVVDESMVAANVAVAQFSTTNRFPFAFRNIDTWGNAYTSQHMMPHYKMGVPGYTRITAPGRRAVDLVTALLLKIGLRNLHLTNVAQSSSANSAPLETQRELFDAFRLDSNESETVPNIFTELQECESTLDSLHYKVIVPYIKLRRLQEFFESNGNESIEVRVSHQANTNQTTKDVPALVKHLSTGDVFRNCTVEFENSDVDLCSITSFRSVVSARLLNCNLDNRWAHFSLSKLEQN